MQGLARFGSGRMNISKGEMVVEAVLAPFLVAAADGRIVGILVGAKHHVPNRKVCEVLRVVPVLVMDPVCFRALHEATQPTGGVDVPVVEKLG